MWVNHLQLLIWALLIIYLTITMTRSYYINKGISVGPKHSLSLSLLLSHSPSSSPPPPFVPLCPSSLPISLPPSPPFYAHSPLTPFLPLPLSLSQFPYIHLRLSHIIYIFTPFFISILSLSNPIPFLSLPSPPTPSFSTSIIFYTPSLPPSMHSFSPLLEPSLPPPFVPLSLYLFCPYVSCYLKIRPWKAEDQEDFK